MASMTIRNLDDDLKRALLIQAARNGVSMEAEVRALLAKGVAQQDTDRDAGGSPWDRLQRIKAENGGGIDLDLPPRGDWTFRAVDLGE